MTIETAKQTRSAIPLMISVIVILVAGAGVWANWSWMGPKLNALIGQKVETPPAHDEHDGHDHADGHDHDHGSETASIVLTPQAQKNLGLTDEFLKPVEIKDFERTISIPGIVTGRPGRTLIHVSTPLTGTVTHVHAVKGEAVVPGALLCILRLTHEDLVTAQTEFLKTLGDLEVETREIARLSAIVDTGALPNKILLERNYTREKLEVLNRVHREALKLHGLTENQINKIASEKQLLRDLIITAPDSDQHGSEEELRLSPDSHPIEKAEAVAEKAKAELAHDHLHEVGKEILIIDELNVEKGQSVSAGQKLYTLNDFCRLAIEGQAYEQDANLVMKALEQDVKLQATFIGSTQQVTISDLKLYRIGNAIDPVTRTLPFYLDLPNEILRDETNSESQRFVSWKYLPGQRVTIKMPVELWKEEIVLPVDAVARSGADAYVFLQNGNEFERTPVHILYRDQWNVVIANDGSIFPGDIVAMRSAHQLDMAIRNKSGGAIDPHAGHNH
jgi:biotin carboxyl carrier protein